MLDATKFGRKILLTKDEIMKISNTFLPFCFLFLAGFGSSTFAQQEISKDHGQWGEISDHMSKRNYGSVTALARTYCQNNGFGVPKITKTKEGCMLFCGGEWDKYEFVCGDRPVTSGRITNADMEALGSQCVTLGFQKGTVDYGQCVLKLVDINSRQNSSSQPTVNINR